MVLIIISLILQPGVTPQSTRSIAASLLSAPQNKTKPLLSRKSFLTKKQTSIFCVFFLFPKKHIFFFFLHCGKKQQQQQQQRTGSQSQQNCYTVRSLGSSLGITGVCFGVAICFGETLCTLKYATRAMSCKRFRNVPTTPGLCVSFFFFFFVVVVCLFVCDGHIFFVLCLGFQTEGELDEEAHFRDMV